MLGLVLAFIDLSITVAFEKMSKEQKMHICVESYFFDLTLKYLHSKKILDINQVQSSFSWTEMLLPKPLSLTFIGKILHKFDCFIGVQGQSTSRASEHWALFHFQCIWEPILVL